MKAWRDFQPGLWMKEISTGFYPEELHSYEETISFWLNHGKNQRVMGQAQMLAQNKENDGVLKVDTDADKHNQHPRIY